jgi:hypothetical protein
MDRNEILDKIFTHLEKITLEQSNNIRNIMFWKEIIKINDIKQEELTNFMNIGTTSFNSIFQNLLNNIENLEKNKTSELTDEEIKKIKYSSFKNNFLLIFGIDISNLEINTLNKNIKQFLINNPNKESLLISYINKFSEEQYYMFDDKGSSIRELLDNSVQQDNINKIYIDIKSNNSNEENIDEENDLYGNNEEENDLYGNNEEENNLYGNEGSESLNTNNNFDFDRIQNQKQEELLKLYPEMLIPDDDREKEYKEENSGIPYKNPTQFDKETLYDFLSQKENFKYIKYIKTIDSSLQEIILKEDFDNLNLITGKIDQNEISSIINDTFDDIKKYKIQLKNKLEPKDKKEIKEKINKLTENIQKISKTDNFIKLSTSNKNLFKEKYLENTLNVKEILFFELPEKTNINNENIKKLYENKNVVFQQEGNILKVIFLDEKDFEETTSIEEVKKDIFMLENPKVINAAKYKIELLNLSGDLTIDVRKSLLQKIKDYGLYFNQKEDGTIEIVINEECISKDTNKNKVLKDFENEITSITSQLIKEFPKLKSSNIRVTTDVENQEIENIRQKKQKDLVILENFSFNGEDIFSKLDTFMTDSAKFDNIFTPGERINIVDIMYNRYPKSVIDYFKKNIQFIGDQDIDEILKKLNESVQTTTGKQQILKNMESFYQTIKIKKEEDLKSLSELDKQLNEGYFNKENGNQEYLAKKEQLEKRLGKLSKYDNIYNVIENIRIDNFVTLETKIFERKLNSFGNLMLLDLVDTFSDNKYIIIEMELLKQTINSEINTNMKILERIILTKNFLNPEDKKNYIKGILNTIQEKITDSVYSRINKSNNRNLENIEFKKKIETVIGNNIKKFFMIDGDVKSFNDINQQLADELFYNKDSIEAKTSKYKQYTSDRFILEYDKLKSFADSYKNGSEKAPVQKYKEESIEYIESRILRLINNEGNKDKKRNLTALLQQFQSEQALIKAEDIQGRTLLYNKYYKEIKTNEDYKESFEKDEERRYKLSKSEQDGDFLTAVNIRLELKMEQNIKENLLPKVMAFIKSKSPEQLADKDKIKYEINNLVYNLMLLQENEARNIIMSELQSIENKTHIFSSGADKLGFLATMDENGVAITGSLTTILDRFSRILYQNHLNVANIMSFGVADMVEKIVENGNESTNTSDRIKKHVINSEKEFIQEFTEFSLDIHSKYYTEEGENLNSLLLKYQLEKEIELKLPNNSEITKIKTPYSFEMEIFSEIVGTISYLELKDNNITPELIQNYLKDIVNNKFNMINNEIDKKEDYISILEKSKIFNEKLNNLIKNKNTNTTLESFSSEIIDIIKDSFEEKDIQNIINSFDFNHFFELSVEENETYMKENEEIIEKEKKDVNELKKIKQILHYSYLDNNDLGKTELKNINLQISNLYIFQEYIKSNDVNGLTLENINNKLKELKLPENVIDINKLLETNGKINTDKINQLIVEKIQVSKEQMLEISKEIDTSKVLKDSTVKSVSLLLKKYQSDNLTETPTLNRLIYDNDGKIKPELENSGFSGDLLSFIKDELNGTFINEQTNESILEEQKYKTIHLSNLKRRWQEASEVNKFQKKIDELNQKIESDFYDSVYKSIEEELKKQALIDLILYSDEKLNAQYKNYIKINKSKNIEDFISENKFLEKEIINILPSYNIDNVFLNDILILEDTEAKRKIAKNLINNKINELISKYNEGKMSKNDISNELLRFTESDDIKDFNNDGKLLKHLETSVFNIINRNYDEFLNYNVEYNGKILEGNRKSDLNKNLIQYLENLHEISNAMIADLIVEKTMNDLRNLKEYRNYSQNEIELIKNSILLKSNRISGFFNSEYKQDFVNKDINENITPEIKYNSGEITSQFLKLLFQKNLEEVFKLTKDPNQKSFLLKFLKENYPNIDSSLSKTIIENIDYKKIRNEVSSNVDGKIKPEQKKLNKLSSQEEFNLKDFVNNENNLNIEYPIKLQTVKVDKIELYESFQRRIYQEKYKVDESIRRFKLNILIKKLKGFSKALDGSTKNNIQYESFKQIILNLIKESEFLFNDKENSSKEFNLNYEKLIKSIAILSDVLNGGTLTQEQMNEIKIKFIKDYNGIDITNLNNNINEELSKPENKPELLNIKEKIYKEQAKIINDKLISYISNLDKKYLNDKVLNFSKLNDIKNIFEDSKLSEKEKYTKLMIEKSKFDMFLTDKEKAKKVNDKIKLQELQEHINTIIEENYKLVKNNKGKSTNDLKSKYKIKLQSIIQLQNNEEKMKQLYLLESEVIENRTKNKEINIQSFDKKKEKNELEFEKNEKLLKIIDKLKNNEKLTKLEINLILNSNEFVSLNKINDFKLAKAKIKELQKQKTFQESLSVLSEEEKSKLLNVLKTVTIETNYSDNLKESTSIDLKYAHRIQDFNEKIFQDNNFKISMTTEELVKIDGDKKSFNFDLENEKNISHNEMFILNIMYPEIRFDLGNNNNLSNEEFLKKSLDKLKLECNEFNSFDSRKDETPLTINEYSTLIFSKIMSGEFSKHTNSYNEELDKSFIERLNNLKEKILNKMTSDNPNDKNEILNNLDDHLFFRSFQNGENKQKLNDIQNIINILETISNKGAYLNIDYEKFILDFGENYKVLLDDNKNPDYKKLKEVVAIFKEYMDLTQNNPLNRTNVIEIIQKLKVYGVDYTKFVFNAKSKMNINNDGSFYFTRENGVVDDCFEPDSEKQDQSLINDTIVSSYNSRSLDRYANDLVSKGGKLDQIDDLVKKSKSLLSDPENPSETKKITVSNIDTIIKEMEDNISKLDKMQKTIESETISLKGEDTKNNAIYTDDLNIAQYLDFGSIKDNGEIEKKLNSIYQIDLSQIDQEVKKYLEDNQIEEMIGEEPNPDYTDMYDKLYTEKSDTFLKEKYNELIDNPESIFKSFPQIKYKNKLLSHAEIFTKFKKKTNTLISEKLAQQNKLNQLRRLNSELKRGNNPINQFQEKFDKIKSRTRQKEMIRKLVKLYGDPGIISEMNEMDNSMDEVMEEHFFQKYNLQYFKDNLDITDPKFMGRMEVFRKDIALLSKADEWEEKIKDKAKNAAKGTYDFTKNEVKNGASTLLSDFGKGISL